MVTKTLQSPSNLLWLTMQLSDAGEFTYSLRWGNQEVLAPSRLGLQLQNQPPLQSGLELQHTLFRNFNETWENPLGEARLNHNQYNEATLYLSEKAGNRRLLTLRFRIFDDGLAFRYEIPAQPSLNYQNLVIADELTEFNFDRRARLWQIPAYQKDRYEYVYTEVALPDLTVVTTATTGNILNTYGQSPYLTAETGVEMVKGLQNKNQLKAYLTFDAKEKNAPYVRPWQRVSDEAHAAGIASPAQVKATAAFGATGNNVSDEFKTTALQVAHESITLLKNAGNILPLDTTWAKRITVCGDAQLVAEHHKQRGGDHIGEERDHEHLIREASLEVGPGGAQQRVESSDHHDRQIRLEENRDVRSDEDADHHADDQSQHRCHHSLLLAWATSPDTAASSLIESDFATCG